MKLILKTIWVVYVLVLMNNAVAQEIHNQENHEVLWFSTSTSGLLNRSSTELATNHVSRGIRFAQQALQKELVLSDQLIASHNLCIGFLSTGETEASTEHCALAAEIAQLSFKIFKIRGAYFLSDKVALRNTLGSNSLYQTVIGNIELQNSPTRLSLFKK